MAKNQNEKNELKGTFTGIVQGLVEVKFGGTDEAPVSVKTEKGFALKVDGEVIEVTCVVKTAKFNLEDAHEAYLEKVASAEKRGADRLEAKAKREAKKAKAQSED